MTGPEDWTNWLKAGAAILGIGAALLERGTRACDDQQMPAYLESSNRLNVPLYQRHGFEVIHQQRISARGPTVWFMWRDPR